MYKSLRLVVQTSIAIAICAELPLQGQMLVQNLLWTNPPDYVIDSDFTQANYGKKIFCSSLAGSIAQVVRYPPPALSKFAAFIDPCWNRVVYLEENYNAIRSYGSPGSGLGQFMGPRDIEVRTPSYWGYSQPGFYQMFIADTGNDRVQCLSYVWIQPELGLQHRQYITDPAMTGPIALDVDNRGSISDYLDDIIWVATLENKILGFSSTAGELLIDYGSTGGGTGQFDNICGLACGVDAHTQANDGTIYIADEGNYRLVKLRWLGSSLQWEGEIPFPVPSVRKLECDSFGHLWIVSYSGTICKYTAELEFLGSIGTAGNAYDQLNMPTGLSCAGGYLGSGGMLLCDQWGSESGIKGFTIGTGIKDLYANSFTGHSGSNTAFMFVLQDLSYVSISVFDSNDQQVRELTSQVLMSSGYMGVGWDNRDASGIKVPQGYYYVVVRAESSYVLYGTNEPSAVVSDTAWFYTDDEPCTWLVGDADGNGNYSIGDAVYIINYVFGGGPAPTPHPIGSGDADCNGNISIGDQVFIINLIFGGGPQPQCSCEDY